MTANRYDRTGKVRVEKLDEGYLTDDPASRQELIQGWNQELIRNSRVMVVGVGALGNEVVKNLVLLGVGYIRLVDNDYVEGSNLSRSVLFIKEDAEKRVPKVEAAVRAIKKLDPYGYIKAEGLFLDITTVEYPSELFSDVDVVFTALDNLEARIHVNNIAYLTGIPLIDGGMDGPMGHIQVVVPPYTSCLYCSVTDRDALMLADKLSCEGLPVGIGEPKVPAVITTTSIIAGFMVHEFVKLIHGIDTYRSRGEWNRRLGEPLAGKRLFVNLSWNRFVVYDVEKSSRCPLH